MKYLLQDDKSLALKLLLHSNHTIPYTFYVIETDVKNRIYHEEVIIITFDLPFYECVWCCWQTQTLRHCKSTKEIFCWMCVHLLSTYNSILCANCLKEAWPYFWESDQKNIDDKCGTIVFSKKNYIHYSSMATY